jgi:hypothetical protein
MAEWLDAIGLAMHPFNPNNATLGTQRCYPARVCDMFGNCQWWLVIFKALLFIVQLLFFWPRKIIVSLLLKRVGPYLLQSELYSVGN